jgi:hypothetical protein
MVTAAGVGQTCGLSDSPILVLDPFGDESALLTPSPPTLAKTQGWGTLCGNDAGKHLYTRLFPRGKKLPDFLIQEFLVGRTATSAGRVSP